MTKISSALFITVAVAILSCGKDKESPDTTNYIGTWELTRTFSDGFIYTSKDYAAGNGNIVTYRDKQTLIKQVKTDSGSSTNQYIYHLERDKFCLHEEPIDTFLYYGTQEPEILRLQNGELFLESTMCVSGGGSAGGSVYRKLK